MKHQSEQRVDYNGLHGQNGFTFLIYIIPAVNKWFAFKRLVEPNPPANEAKNYSATLAAFTWTLLIRL
jgi:hypothetical protein